MNNEDLTESLCQNFDQILRIFLPPIRQNRKSGRFVDNKKILVLIQNMHDAELINHRDRSLFSASAKYRIAMAGLHYVTI